MSSTCSQSCTILQTYTFLFFRSIVSLSSIQVDPDSSLSLSLSRSLDPSSSASRHSSWHKRKCDKCLLMSNNVTIMPVLLYPKDVQLKTNDQDNRYIRTWLCFWEQMWRICLFRPGWSKDNSSCFSSKAKISFKFKCLSKTLCECGPCFVWKTKISNKAKSTLN